MKGRTAIIATGALFLVLLASYFLLHKIRETGLRKSFHADARFIETAVIEFFRENPEQKRIALNELVDWSKSRDGKMSWTITLDPQASYSGEFQVGEVKIIHIEHPFFSEAIRLER